jgi:hypothetical protein
MDESAVGKRALRQAYRVRRRITSATLTRKISATGGCPSRHRGRWLEGRDDLADVLSARRQATMLKVMEPPTKLVNRRTAGAVEKRYQKR